jgi:DNA ligase (NAD+)
VYIIDNVEIVRKIPTSLTIKVDGVEVQKNTNTLKQQWINEKFGTLDYFKKYNLGVGDIIEIERANDIIPQIHKVIKRVESNRIELLSFCPYCNENLIVNGAYLECENDNCPAGYLGNLEKYVDVLDIKDISTAIIEKLYKESLINIPSDFYKLTKEDFAKIPGLGLKVGQKIINEFNSKKELDLPTFISSLNINGVSKSIIEKISNKGYDNIEKIQNITLEQLLKIPGIKDITANKILIGLEKKKDIIKLLLNHVSLEQCQNKGTSLSGKSFVFTGAINKVDKSGNRMKREYLQQLVRENGGLTPSSISKGVSYLVQADPNSMSTKSSKAKSYGVEILGEESFFKMLDSHGIEY